jgi:hypothetical protein
MTPFDLLHFFIYFTSSHYNLCLQCIRTFWRCVSERSFDLFCYLFGDFLCVSSLLFSSLLFSSLCLFVSLFYLSSLGPLFICLCLSWVWVWVWVLCYDRRSVGQSVLLLALAIAVILGSEPLGTRDRILLSQIWEFPFRRLLRLAGCVCPFICCPSYTVFASGIEDTSLPLLRFSNNLVAKNF